MYTSKSAGEKVEPAFTSQEPIIVGVDARLESPDTLAVQFNEGVFRDSMLSMATYDRPHGHQQSIQDYDSRAYAESTGFESPYGQTFSEEGDHHGHHSSSFSEHHDSGPRQHINQESFAANNAVSAVSHFIENVPVVPVSVPAHSVLSFQPDSGIAGTMIFLKISSRYDLSGFLFSIVFGSRATEAKFISEAQEGTDGAGGLMIYEVSSEVPEHVETGCQESNVPVSVVIEGQGGGEIVRLAVGHFFYHDAPGGSGAGAGAGAGATSPSDLVTRRTAGTCPAGLRDESSSPRMLGQLPLPPQDASAAEIAVVPRGEPGTNTYATAFSSGGGGGGGGGGGAGGTTMPETYRQPDRQYPYPRGDAVSAPPVPPSRSPLRAAGWGVAPFSHLATTGSGSINMTESPRIGSRRSEPMLSPLSPMVLVRTAVGNSIRSGGSDYASYYNVKAELKVMGRLSDMPNNWTSEEWQNQRRIVKFMKSQPGSSVNMSFRPVNIRDCKQHEGESSIYINCIWWAEKGECYITSVDTIALLEYLCVAPEKFAIDEKNRIRRNLEGFRPLTVAKAKADTEKFFKVIMAFGAPKPRNIEKDIKVFPWKVLEPALKKIIGKYSIQPRSSAAAASVIRMGVSNNSNNNNHSSSGSNQAPSVMTQPSLVGYPTPAPSIAATYATMHHSSSSHDSMASPRSISTSPQGWYPTTSTTTATSPSYYAPPPLLPLPPPPATAMSTRIMSPTSLGAAMSSRPQPLHRTSATTAMRWDPHHSSSSLALDSYADGYQHHQHYGASSYGSRP